MIPPIIVLLPVSSSACMSRVAIIRKYVDQNGGIEEAVGLQDDDRGMNRFVLDRQTTNDKRRMINDKRQTTNDETVMARERIAARPIVSPR